ncbi:MAG: hypothetical protein ACRD16_01295, partial [Thermoanaerobaculia bacterium]
PVAAQAAPSPGPAQRLTAATPATESPAEAARNAPRTRRPKQKFERVGIPMESRSPEASPAPGEISEKQAQKALRRLIQARGYYGLSPACLQARPVGRRDSAYGFEIVAATCPSIVRGSVIGRWRVDAASGEASYRTPEGTYQRAP